MQIWKSPYSRVPEKPLLRSFFSKKKFLYHFLIVCCNVIYCIVFNFVIIIAVLIFTNSLFIFILSKFTLRNESYNQDGLNNTEYDMLYMPSNFCRVQVSKSQGLQNPMLASLIVISSGQASRVFRIHVLNLRRFLKK